LTAFIDYVEENPDTYRALVRGPSSGDAELRAISDATRSVLAGRVITAAGADSPGAELAVHGWVAYVEECVCRWTETRQISRDQLLDLLAAALPALVAVAK
jgi:hypothetical protein